MVGVRTRRAVPEDEVPAKVGGKEWSTVGGTVIACAAAELIDDD